MSRLGWADLGLATQTDMVSNASMIASIDPSIPLIADADTGYGGPVMVSRTIRKYAAAGIAALHIEDQVQEKRCGHLLGKELVTREIFYSRLRAAVQAKNDYGSDILIIARTDARQKYGFEEACERLKGAVEIGVDAVFPEALPDVDELKEMVKRIGNTPCLLNMISGGHTPDLTVEQAKDVGFRMMIFPCLGFEAAMVGMRDWMKILKDQGKQPDTQISIKEAFEVCGLNECVELDKRAGGTAYKELGQ